MDAPPPGNVCIIDNAVSELTDETELKTAGSSASGQAGETSGTGILADAQLADAELGPLIKMRLQSATRPEMNEIMMYGEPVKLLVSQWEQLEIKDGLVYRRWAPKAIGSEVLQLLVPASRRQDFLNRPTQALQADILVLNAPCCKFNAEHFGLTGVGM